MNDEFSPQLAQDAQGNRLIPKPDISGQEPGLGGDEIIKHAMEFIDTFVQAPDNPSRNTRPASKAIDAILNQDPETRMGVLHKLFGVYETEHGDKTTNERAWENVTVLLSGFWSRKDKASIDEKKAIIDRFQQELLSDRVAGLSRQQQYGWFHRYNRTGLENQINIVAGWHNDAVTESDLELREHAANALLESATSTVYLYNLLRRRTPESRLLSKDIYDRSYVFFTAKTAEAVASATTSIENLPRDLYDVLDGRAICAIYANDITMADQFVDDVVALDYESLRINSHYQGRHEFINDRVVELTDVFPERSDEWGKKMIDSGKISSSEWDAEIKFKRSTLGGNGLRP